MHTQCEMVFVETMIRKAKSFVEIIEGTKKASAQGSVDVRILHM